MVLGAGTRLASPARPPGGGSSAGRGAVKKRNPLPPSNFSSPSPQARLSFTIYGQPASKANRRRFVLVKGRARSIKSPEALAFAADMLAQIPPAARVMFTGPCAIRLRMFYRDNRSDLDESVVLDCLQAQYATVTQHGQRVRVLTRRGVVVNDRQFKVRHVYHGIDPDCPRVEVKVWQLTT